jgi:hypothetical protein
MNEMILESSSSSAKSSILLTVSSDSRVNLLKVVIRLLELVVEEQVVLRKLEVSEVQLLDHIVSQYVGYECELWLW